MGTSAEVMRVEIVSQSRLQLMLIEDSCKAHAPSCRHTTTTSSTITKTVQVQHYQRRLPAFYCLNPPLSGHSRGFHNKATREQNSERARCWLLSCWFKCECTTRAEFFKRGVRSRVGSACVGGYEAVDSGSRS